MRFSSVLVVCLADCLAHRGNEARPEIPSAPNPVREPKVFEIDNIKYTCYRGCNILKNRELKENETPDVAMKIVNDCKEYCNCVKMKEENQCLTGPSLVREPSSSSGYSLTGTKSIPLDNHTPPVQKQAPGSSSGYSLTGTNSIPLDNHTPPVHKQAPDAVSGNSRQLIVIAKFESVFGFTERPSDSKAKDVEGVLTVEYSGGKIELHKNGDDNEIISIKKDNSKKTFDAGSFAVQSSAALLNEIKSNIEHLRKINLESKFEVIGADVNKLHEERGSKDKNDTPMFQVASLANCLQIKSPKNSPDEGVSDYQYNRAQGSMCAMEALPGTLLRSVFYRWHDKTLIGQSKNRQINILEDFLESSISCNGQDIEIKSGLMSQPINGYVMLNNTENLVKISSCIHQMRSDRQSDYRTLVEKAATVGVSLRTQIVGNMNDLDSTSRIIDEKKFVSQVYTSALPFSVWRGIGYDAKQNLEGLAIAQLTGQFLGTFYAHIANYARSLSTGRDKSGANKLFLTALGNGGFGNRFNWVMKAMCQAWDFAKQALQVLQIDINKIGLHVALVLYFKSIVLECENSDSLNSLQKLT